MYDFQSRRGTVNSFTNLDDYKQKRKKVSCNSKYSSNGEENDARDELLPSANYDRNKNKRLGQSKTRKEDNKNKQKQSNIKRNTAIRGYLYDSKGSFNKALELFNRLQCIKTNDGVWRSQGPYFECKGAVRVALRMCLRCRDSYKQIGRTDLYYVDKTERLRERTILCHGCMGFILLDCVGGDQKQIKQTLEYYRKRQGQAIYLN